MRVAYLVNEYPKISHTFIRREIHALERLGVQIDRYSIRGWNSTIIDPDDRAEFERTTFVLRGGLASLIPSVLRVALTRPGRFVRAFLLILSICRRGSQRSFPFHLAYLAEACWLFEALTRRGAEHLHAHFGVNSAETAALVRVLGGPPYSFTVHGQDELLFGGLIEKVRLAKFVVAISSFGASQLYLRLPPTLWSKVTVVRCGLDARSFSGPGVECLQPNNRLVCVGRFCVEKGHLLLLDATAELVRRGQQVNLVLAGDGELRALVEERIALLGLQNHVRITGWLTAEEVRQEIAAARALVLPSFSEGLPIVILEAFAVARPVISTYIGGIPEAVRDGESGWLIPAGSMEALADAMEDALASSLERTEHMGSIGKALVLERHSAEVEGTKLWKRITGDDSPV
jgi:glycosyltransferase involved in cell wall biosynthesis